MRLSRVIFGAMANHGAGDDGQRVAVIQSALARGITSIDTAPLYDFGGSERLVGRAIAGQGEVQVLTKVGLRWDSDHGDVLFATPEVTVRRDSRPERVAEELDQSLERLGVPSVALVQVHHPDPHVPIGETMSALLDAHRAGKVDAIGVSNFSAEQTRAAARALGDVPLATAQDRYSLVYREAEAGAQVACRELGLGCLAYSPLAQGLLAGKLLDGGEMAEGDWRAGDPVFRPDNLRRIHDVMRSVMQPIATRHSGTLSQVALAWLLAQPVVTGVIAGARTEAHVAANAGAMQLALEHGEVRELRRAFEGLRLKTHGGKRAAASALARRGLGKLKRLLK